MDISLITDSGLLPTLRPNSFSNEKLIEQIGVMADQALFKGNADILDDAAKLARIREQPEIEKQLIHSESGIHLRQATIF